MIWQVVKYYRTPFQKTLKTFSCIAAAKQFYNTLNTESTGLKLELFFEDPSVWNPEETIQFTVKSTAL